MHLVPNSKGKTVSIFKWNLRNLFDFFPYKFAFVEFFDRLVSLFWGFKEWTSGFFFFFPISIHPRFLSLKVMFTQWNTNFWYSYLSFTTISQFGRQKFFTKCFPSNFFLPINRQGLCLRFEGVCIQWLLKNVVQEMNYNPNKRFQLKFFNFQDSIFFRLCNPILYACTYSQFLYLFTRQLEIIKYFITCDGPKLRQILGWDSVEPTIIRLPRHISEGSSTQLEYCYGSTNILSDSIVRSHNRTWSSTKSWRENWKQNTNTSNPSKVLYYDRYMNLILIRRAATK